LKAPHFGGGLSHSYAGPDQALAGAFGRGIAERGPLSERCRFAKARRRNRVRGEVPGGRFENCNKTWASND
jgi:hypothetical protein